MKMMRKKRPMSVLPLPSLIRRILVTGRALAVFAAFPLTLYSQSPASSTAPTASEDPAVIDQAWQKASAKYDGPRTTILNEVDRVAHQGPFRPDWESLEKYQVPEWYKDAKFGIFIHWGVYSVPAFGSEWYPRDMYRQDSEVYKHHIATYGPQDKIGYKDFIPMFKAAHFDPASWARLFRESGAKYVVPVAEHHDGFAMYDSGLSDWTAAKMGPKRDVIGDLAQAVRAQGLRFGTSSHRVEHNFFLGVGRTFPSDINDPKYAPSTARHTSGWPTREARRFQAISPTSPPRGPTTGWRALPRSSRNTIPTSCTSTGGSASPQFVPT